MRAYFKPWRRKIGVVTLVIACAFLAPWNRSSTFRDTLNLQFGDYPVRLSSELGTISWTRVLESSPQQHGWEVEAPMGPDSFYEAELPPGQRWQWRWFGFCGVPIRDDSSCWVISYRTIVTFLTLLSAGLLLVPMREVKQQSDDQSAV